MFVLNSLKQPKQQQMNILLIGYGKMGKGIKALAIERGHNIVGVVDYDDSYLLDSEEFIKRINADIAIEFTTPESAWPNIKACLQHGLPTLCGTTGWTQHWDEMIALVQQTKGTFFYTANYSIGVNLFFSLNSMLAKLMSHQPDYRLSLEEIHHIHKKDKPSGTALHLVKDIIAHHKEYSTWSLGPSDNKTQILINCIRESEVAGIHKVTYKGPYDQITISHEAFSRDGFIQGVLIAAEWLFNQRTSGIYDMRDVLK